MTDSAPPSVTFRITEPRETPWLGVYFGSIAMVPVGLGVLAFSLAPEPWRGGALAVTLFWGCVSLTFLSGVRRGVSFRTPGGVTAGQIATTLWLFCLGFAAIVLTALALPLPAAVLLLAGYLSFAVFDPIAARPDGDPGPLPGGDDRAIGGAMTGWNRPAPTEDHTPW